MRVRWYIGVFIVILAVIGFNQTTANVHNQEIVLNFKTVKTSEVEVNSTIEKIKLQLNAAGIINIDVEREVTGQLKIKYYSEETVESIKELLSENHALSLKSSDQNSDEFPIENSDEDYHISIFEIEKGTDSEQGLNGIVSEENNRESQRLSFNPDFFKASFADVKDYKNLLSFKIRVSDIDNFILTDYRIFKTPIARAGPLA